MEFKNKNCNKCGKMVVSRTPSCKLTNEIEVTEC